jgi:hypothetical protein
MKLTTKQMEHAAMELGAKIVPESHPLASQLTRIFGEHTFFVDDEGLDIVEFADPSTDGAMATVVKLAKWADAEHTRLAPHEPEVTDVLVELDAEG